MSDSAPPTKARNTNCLVGMQCPQCGSLEPFAIAILTLITLYDDGSDPSSTGDLEWTDDAYCKCVLCDFDGSVSAFKEKAS